jgi:hypothetical protein
MMWMEICSTLIHGKKWYDHIEILRTRDLESIARHGCRFDPSAFVLDLLQTPKYRAKFQRWTTEFIVWEMLNYPVKWQFYASSKHVPEVDKGVSDRDEYKSSDDEEGSGAAAAVSGPPPVRSRARRVTFQDCRSDEPDVVIVESLSSQTELVTLTDDDDVSIVESSSSRRDVVVLSDDDAPPAAGGGGKRRRF